MLVCPTNYLIPHIEKMKRITGEGKIGRTRLYTSVDTWGPQAEYIRNGLNYNPNGMIMYNVY